MVNEKSPVFAIPGRPILPLLVLLCWCWCTSHVTAQRLQSYPAPGFRTVFTMSSQAGQASFREVAHGLGILPFRVRVYASPTSGDNQDYAFEGQGSAQTDDTVGAYGGLVFGFNTSHVRIWAPSKSSGNSLGRIVFVKDGWGGEQKVQEAQTATVVVEAWRSGPTPSRKATISMTAQAPGCAGSYSQFAHNLQLRPHHATVLVEATDGNNAGYFFYALGSAQTDDDGGAYGGVVFAYDENNVRLWAPCKNAQEPAGNTKGRMISIGDGWAGGHQSQASTTARVHVQLWVDDWPVPSFQSSWFTLKPQDAAGSYRLISHGMGITPSRVVVQVRAYGGNNKNFVFEAQGSAMATDSKNNLYGGLVFAYDNTSVRLWAPDINDDFGNGRIIVVKDGWGNEMNTQAAVSAAVRVLAWRTCPPGQKAFAGSCQQISLTTRTWGYGSWSSCSVACNAGSQQRNITACTTVGKRTEVACNFDANNLCGYQTTAGSTFSVGKWLITAGKTSSSTTGPDYDHTSSYGRYAFVESSGKSKNAVAALTSPTFQGDQSCILYFFWLEYGADIGTLQVDSLIVGKFWRSDLWNVTYNQGKVWRLGEVQLTTLDTTPAASQVRFKVYLGGPLTAGRVSWRGDGAIDDVRVVCDALPASSSKQSTSVCQQNEHPNTGCVMRADRPDVEGPAFQLYPSTTTPVFQYVQPSGKQWDIIGQWKFNVPTYGRYLLWLKVYTFASPTNVRPQMDSATPVNWFIPALQRYQWVAFGSKVYTVGAGMHTLTLRQFTSTGIRIRHIMILPKKPVTFGALGMQSRLISGGAITASTNLSSCLPRDARLHSAAPNQGGWCSQTIDSSQTLTIQLTRPALIYQIATQGRQDAAEWTISYQMSYSLDKSKVQLYTEGGTTRTFAANANQNTVKLNFLSTPIMADMIILNPRTWNTRPALRVELHGLYAESGLCASSGVPSLMQSCLGDMNCSMNGACPMTGNTCQCNTGYYGTRCANNYCNQSLCVNNGTCVALATTFRCSCTAGWYGLTCATPCAPGLFGPGCTQACQCSGRGTCDAKFGKCTCVPGYSGATCSSKCQSGTYGPGCQLQCLCKHASLCHHVNGNCTCNAGYKGTYCDVPCAPNEHGVNCAQNCSCFNGGVCNPVSGACRCLAGFKDANCLTQCGNGTFGLGCLSTCQCKNKAVCSPVDGHCTCTQPGFSGPLCDTNCTAGLYGLNCASKCSCANGACDRANGTCYCDRGWKGSSCATACSSDQFGAGCTQVCTCTNGAQCDRFSGSCTCPKPSCSCQAGWQGSECDKQCPKELWGRDCANKCACKNNATCSRFDGSCMCASGYMGPLCAVACTQGTHGQRCLQNCTCVAGNTKSCDHVSGMCYCNAGWQGQDCSQVCSSGSYGMNCSSSCRCQNGGVCHPVDGSCTCRDGFTGPYCGIPCLGGYYGPHCTRRCRCANSAVCNPVTGACSCTLGWHGLYCDTKCPNGFWGQNCQQNCSCARGSSCRHTDGACQCAAGWQGANCTRACSSGFYGLNCTNTCPPCFHGNGTCHADTGYCSCAAGYLGLYCSQSCPANTWGVGCLGSCSCSSGSVCHPATGKCQCPSGKMGPFCNISCAANAYGPGCVYKCNCLRGTCSPVDGSCACPDGYIGSLCNQVCTQGWYGPSCSKACQCQNSGLCNPADGSCSCATGWTGPICTDTCPTDWYGPNCALRCQCQNGAICNRFTGICFCASGWMGQLCDQVCASGFYGARCHQPCSCQNNASCHHIMGTCTCTAGYRGVNCSQSCGSGTFGMGCQQKCSCYAPNALGPACNPVTGHCQCKAGYYKSCDEACTKGWFGADCGSKCQCQNGATCDVFNGTCLCASGYQGQLCDQRCSNNTYGPLCKGVCSCTAANTDACDHVSGRCLCKPGYEGLACERFCSAHVYGPGCVTPCNCSGRETTCHAITGACTCKPGWTGAQCENPCAHGYYGTRCAFKCNCQNGATCLPSTGACNCTAGFTGRLCDQVCPSGRFGASCSQPCQCNSTTSRGCQAETGDCLCRSGYIQNSGRCNESCLAGLWGPGCSTVCPVCAPYITSHCHVTDGSCACSPGFTGYACDQVCKSNRYGQGCALPCRCGSEHLCNMVTGICQVIAHARFHLLLKTAFRTMNESQAAQTALEIAMDRVLDRELFQNPLASISPDGHLVVTIEDNTLIPTNDASIGGGGSTPRMEGPETTESFTASTSQSRATAAVPQPRATTAVATSRPAIQPPPALQPLVGKQRVYSFNNSVVVRIVSLQPAEAQGLSVSDVEFVVSYNGVPYPSAVVLSLLGNISSSLLDTWLGHQLIRHDGSLVTAPAATKTSSSGGLSSSVVAAIAAAGGVGLILTVVLVMALMKARRRAKENRSDPVYGVSRVSASSITGLVPRSSSVSFHRDGKAGESAVEMSRYSGMVRNSSHLCFDNPYYDVMAAMAVDDDVDGDFINPLYDNKNVIRSGI